jgi:hypothetical protein
MIDSIEYEIVNWEPRQVWRCQGKCGRFRHRPTIAGALPAVCCNVEAKLITSYSQPVPLQLTEAVNPFPHAEP